MNEVAVFVPETAVFASETAVLASEIDGTELRDPDSSHTENPDVENRPKLSFWT
jgi:hypothetical protein